MSGDALELEGVVTNACRGVFVCSVPGLAKPVTAKISGRLNVHRIRILLGDRVKLEVSPYDLGRGRITYRL
jgi:translation initiation factor IF-1